MRKVGVIVLAAGASSRMGSPKQLLEVDGEPLICRTVKWALKLNSSVCCVVVGANSALVQASLNALPVSVIVNDRWSEGIGTSIARGIAFLETGEIDYALFVLCDQPAIPLVHLQRLCERMQETSADIVASEYESTLGVPMAIDKSLFPRLRMFTGNRGAKSLISDPTLRVSSVPCEEAAMDLDTPEDLAIFREAQSDDNA